MSVFIIQHTLEQQQELETHYRDWLHPSHGLHRVQVSFQQNKRRTKNRRLLLVS
jgi:hypothetical protein